MANHQETDGFQYPRRRCKSPYYWQSEIPYEHRAFCSPENSYTYAPVTKNACMDEGGEWRKRTGNNRLGFCRNVAYDVFAHSPVKLQCSNDDTNFTGDPWEEVPRWAMMYTRNGYCFDAQEVVQIQDDQHPYTRSPFGREKEQAQMRIALHNLTNATTPAEVRRLWPEWQRLLRFPRDQRVMARQLKQILVAYGDRQDIVDELYDSCLQ